MTTPCTTPDSHTWAESPRAKTPSIMVPGQLVPQICDGCGTRFPCSHACKHYDCQIERGELVADADGIYRPNAAEGSPW